VGDGARRYLTAATTNEVADQLDIMVTDDGNSYYRDNIGRN